jgi:hypothetical protein
MAMSTEERTLVARPGETAVLSGPGHGVGGYGWTLEIDPAVGRLVAESVRPQQSFGGGAEATFTVELTGREGHARLLLKRSWEGEPARVIDYRITAGE